MIWISSPCGRTPGRDGPSWPDELLFYGSYHFECTRPAAGEPAYCTGGIGEPLGIGSRELAPFRGSVHLGERRDRRDMPYVTLVTPSGSLTNSAVLFVVSASFMGLLYRSRRRSFVVIDPNRRVSGHRTASGPSTTCSSACARASTRW